jgi:hypothetical protein
VQAARLLPQRQHRPGARAHGPLRPARDEAARPAGVEVTRAAEPAGDEFGAYPFVNGCTVGDCGADFWGETEEVSALCLALHLVQWHLGEGDLSRVVELAEGRIRSTWAQNTL